MSFLQQITNNATSPPNIGCRVVIVAQEKMGKTTMACGAPNAILMPLEHGYAGINVNSLPMLTTYNEVLSALDEMINYHAAAAQGQVPPLPFKSLVIDSTTKLEELLHEAVVKADPKSKSGSNMESAHGGYGKGYLIANDWFKGFLDRLDILALTYGMNVVLTAHAFADKVVDPSAGEYSTWNILLHSPKNLKTYGKREMITQWADMIGFLHEPVLVSEASGSSNITLGIDAGKGRILGVQRKPAYVAGNRYGLTEEIPIPLVNGWDALATAIHNSRGLNYFAQQPAQQQPAQQQAVQPQQTQPQTDVQS